MRSGVKILFFTVFLFCGVWLLGKFILPFLLPFLLGTGLALAAEPLVGLLCRRLRLPRGAGAGLGVTAAFFLTASLLLSLAALAVQQLKALAGILPDLEQAVRSGITLMEQWLVRLTDLAPLSLRPLLRQNIRSLFSGGTAFLGRAASWILGLAGGVLTHIPGQALSLGTAVISGYMISAKLPEIRTQLRRILDREQLKPLLTVAARLKTALGRLLLAQAKLASVAWLILTGGFILLAVPYAPLWALAVTVLDALPVLGTGTVLIPWALVCLLRGNGARALGLAGIYVTVSLTRTVLEPRLVGRHLGLDPLVTLGALYAGYRIWGFGGMILAPMLAVTALQLLPEPPEMPGNAR